MSRASAERNRTLAQCRPLAGQPNRYNQWRTSEWTRRKAEVDALSGPFEQFCRPTREAPLVNGPDRGIESTSSERHLVLEKGQNITRAPFGRASPSIRFVDEGPRPSQVARACHRSAQHRAGASSFRGTSNPPNTHPLATLPASKVRCCGVSWPTSVTSKCGAFAALAARSLATLLEVLGGAHAPEDPCRLDAITRCQLLLMLAQRHGTIGHDAPRLKL